MKYRDLSDHPGFSLLLAWRAVLISLALYAVIDKSFVAMLMALGVLGALALVGEFVFTCKVSADNRSHQQQAERESRQRRAEEARARYAEAQVLLNQDGKKGFALDDVGQIEVSPAQDDDPLTVMSAEDFDLALVDGELAQRGDRPNPLST